MQSQVALSTTEAEYISLSSALREVIPLMDLAKELRDKFNFDIFCSEIDVFCHAFEDNLGALEIAKLPKMRPRTKHINICYHHFRERVRRGEIKLHAISTDDQVADMLTKPLPQNTLWKHRKSVIGM